MVIAKGGLEELLMLYYQRLYDHFGPQNWWPGDTKIEICVGAILTQNTNWNNVAKAIKNLKNAEVLTLPALYNIPIHNLAELIRPAGYFNVKAKRLKNFIHFVWDRHGQSLDNMFQLETEELRQELLSVKGIGPETADSILLYGGNKPTFVIDAYTMRILRRHDIIDEDCQYEQARMLFMDNLPMEVSLYNEYHALLVALGKHFCRPRKPKCESCPLKGA